MRFHLDRYRSNTALVPVLSANLDRFRVSTDACEREVPKSGQIPGVIWAWLSQNGALEPQMWTDSGRFCLGAGNVGGVGGEAKGPYSLGQAANMDRLQTHQSGFGRVGVSGVNLNENSLLAIIRKALGAKIAQKMLKHGQIPGHGQAKCGQIQVLRLGWVVKKYAKMDRSRAPEAAIARFLIKHGQMPAVNRFGG
jgi:hypothetical protein